MEQTEKFAMNELYWLSLTIAVTALMWIPYVLNSFVVRGIVPTMGYDEGLAPLSPWAERAKRAHTNAVENLVLFGISVVAFWVATEGRGDASVASAAALYLIARIAHYVVYAAKVPVVRTLTFLVGWGAQLYVLWRLVLAVAA